MSLRNNKTSRQKTTTIARFSPFYFDEAEREHRRNELDELQKRRDEECARKTSDQKANEKEKFNTTLQEIALNNREQEALNKKDGRTWRVSKKNHPQTKPVYDAQHIADQIKEYDRLCENYLDDDGNVVGMTVGMDADRHEITMQCQIQKIFDEVYPLYVARDAKTLACLKNTTYFKLHLQAYHRSVMLEHDQHNFISRAMGEYFSETDFNKQEEILKSIVCSEDFNSYFYQMPDNHQAIINQYCKKHYQNVQNRLGELLVHLSKAYEKKYSVVMNDSGYTSAEGLGTWSINSDPSPYLTKEQVTNHIRANQEIPCPSHVSCPIIQQLNAAIRIKKNFVNINNEANYFDYRRALNLSYQTLLSTPQGSHQSNWAILATNHSSWIDFWNTIRSAAQALGITTLVEWTKEKLVENGGAFFLFAEAIKPAPKPSLLPAQPKPSS